MSKTGYTLTELMLTVAIIGVLASIALPRLGDALRSAHEAATKGNLGAIRSALSIYYGDTEGQMPHDNLRTLVTDARYLGKISFAYTPTYHADSSYVVVGSTQDETAGAGGWFYNTSDSLQFGHVEVNCAHKDLRGDVWFTL